jgi:hypothetical protein
VALDAVRGYLELCLRLDRHLDGLVDGYYGPPEIAVAVEGEPPRPPAELVAEAAALRGSLDGLEPARARWLDAQLVGLETVARRLAGEDLQFAEEVERCYGVRPERVPEDVFEASHRELDELLPGGGSLAERFRAWQEADTLSPAQLKPFAEGLAADLRRRTADAFGLPEGESLRFELVSNEPWGAFNYYEGGLHSRIAINTDVPLAAERALHMVAHETYPGHHTEHVTKEQLLVREGGCLEESILMIATPQALIAEGIAETGARTLLGDGLEELGGEHLARVGIAFDADLARAVRRALGPLEGIAGNVALLLHEDGLSPGEATAYLTRWDLTSEQRAAKTVAFLTDPLWRSYLTTYTDGERVCAAWIDGDPQRFRRLLTEQLVPADLV